MQGIQGARKVYIQARDTGYGIRDTGYGIGDTGYGILAPFFSYTHYRNRTDNPVGAGFESAVFTYFTKRALLPFFAFLMKEYLKITTLNYKSETK